MGFYFNEGDVRRLYRLLGFNRDYIAETRCIDLSKNVVVSREYQLNENAFVQWAKAFNGKGNCFVGRNPRLLLNRESIAHIRTITLDLDPDRPKGVSATEAQTEECVKAARAIFEKYNGGSLGLSGNGVLLIWTTPNPHPTSKQLEQQLKAFQEEAKKIINDKNIKGVKVDATQDNPRLIKLIGTVSVKGEIRATKFLDVASSGGDGERVFGLVASLNVDKPLDQRSLLVQSNYPSRSEADYALAVHYKQSGLGPDDCMDALGRHVLGRNDRHDDHVRIIEKVYSDTKIPFGGNKAPSVSNGADIVLHSPTSSLDKYGEELQKRGSHDKPELPTGFEVFDEATHGLRRGEIYTVAARPSVGKSSYLINVASSVCEAGRRVIFFSTEMPYHTIWDRIISSNAEIDGKAFNTGRFSSEEQQKFNQFRERFKRYDFHVLDSFQPDIDAVRAASIKVKPDVIFFDHIQHVGGNSANEVKMLSDFTRGLKSLAMELKCAVVVASQLRRPQQMMSYKTGEVQYAEPSLSDLKGCGTIEEESAFVLILWNEAGVSLGEDEPFVNGKLAKNRFGPTVNTQLVFYKSITKFKTIREV